MLRSLGTSASGVLVPLLGEQAPIPVFLVCVRGLNIRQGRILLINNGSAAHSLILVIV